jgi:putative component of membrane protein insertase Oxa1/YidC/SpoIIIJ protein YidD
LIRSYQAAGGGARVFAVHCNFTPTCSHYAAGAIERFGLWRGARLAWRRIRCCNRRDLLEPIDDPLPERLP